MTSLVYRRPTLSLYSKLIRPGTDKIYIINGVNRIRNFSRSARIFEDRKGDIVLSNALLCVEQSNIALIKEFSR